MYIWAGAPSPLHLVPGPRFKEKCGARAASRMPEPEESPVLMHGILFATPSTTFLLNTY